jgi:hypothetical protein
MSIEAADRVLADMGARLAEAIDVALAGWVERSVVMIHEAWSGDVPTAVMDAARDAGIQARTDVVPRVRELLGLDVDNQWTNPLQLLRGAVVYPTSVLHGAGVGEVERDDFAARTAPDDVYGLEPAGFADVDGALHDIGLAWGAAKAQAHLARRR